MIDIYMIWFHLTMATYSPDQPLDVWFELDGTIIIIGMVKIFRQLVPKTKRHLSHLEVKE